MSNNYINFKQKRDLGTTISDTFAFLRNEYKTIFKLYFRHVGIVLLLLVAATTYYQYQSLNLTTSAQLGNTSFITELLPNLGFGFAAMIILSVVYYALSICTISGLIKSYVENKGVINEDEVRDLVNQKFLKMSGAVLLIGIILIVGFMLCFLPGIYLMVPFSLVVYVMIFQNKGFSDAVTESFNLIKDNWWITFATILVVGILISVISSVFQLPIIILTAMETFTSLQSENPSSMFGEMSSKLLYIVFYIIAYLAQYILGLVTIIAVSFIYFNLNEIHNKTGTLEDIDQIGNA